MAVQNLDWNGVINLIANYYNADAASVEATLIANGCEAGNVTEAFKMLENSPYQIFYNADGSVRSYAYANIGTVMENGVVNASELNSNVVQTKTAVKIPLNTTLAEPATPSTPVTWKSGLSSAGNFVFGSLIPAVAAANVGITLGKTIDGALYNINPDFFDSIGWGSLNPETWNSITAGMEDSIATRVFNTVFKLDPNTGKSQAYLDQTAVAYLTKILYDKGFFDVGETEIIGQVDNVEIQQPLYVYDNINLVIDERGYYDVMVPSGVRMTVIQNIPQSVVIAVTDSSNSSNNYIIEDFYIDGVLNRSRNRILDSVSVNGKTFYYGSFGYGATPNHEYSASQSDLNTALNIRDINKATGYALLFGTEHSTTALDGVGTQTGATTPTIDPNDNIDTILQKLQTQYPDLFNNAVTANVVQPDGTVKNYTYIPIAQADPNPNPTQGNDPSEQPISGSSTQADTSFNPDDNTADMIQYILDILTQIPDYNDETTGEGNTPPVTTPTGSANALYSVYNPTESEIHSFGSWLWSTNFVDQLLKMFNDPMQAIISLHKVFCTPQTSGRNDIKVGYLNSGVQANVVSGQYVDIDCGSVSLPEEFQSVFDYAPYTDVTIYLPFIGFTRLDVNDVMRASIQVMYHVDVLTGACLAEVKVTRDGVGGTLYQYTGDCSVHYPLSSGSYMGVVGALLGVAGTIASGGALAPMALGVASGVMGARSNVERSGSLSGNAGAMGIKKPYLVLQKPQINMPDDFNSFVGLPSYDIVKISECTGFIKCIEVHALATPATESELNELISILKEGVLI